MVLRHLVQLVQSAARTMPVVSITGPRQSGKTTMAKHAFPDYAYANLEHPPTRQYALENPVGFLQQYPNGLIVDEAQYAPELFSYIQVEVDKTRKNGQYVLSGSQNFLLMEKITQSLAGRAAVFNLLPFSVAELKNTEYHFENPFDYIVKGFYPRVYDQNTPLDIFYPSYMQTYLERDVRLLKNIGDLSGFERFIRLCAGHIGQVFNQSKIANDTSFTQPTIRSWFSVLETSFIAFLLPPYFKNFNKRLLKTPKLYFYDTGLACSILGIRNGFELENHPMRGPLFENFIIVEMMKQFVNNGQRPPCYFWMDSAGHEIDLLIEQNAQLFPMEIKASQTMKSDFFKNLTFFQQIAHVPSEQCYVVYSGTDEQNRLHGKACSWLNMPQFHTRI
jgi:predicted AAA+ superfamily ATPase